jgi:hypothetical protein
LLAVRPGAPATSPREREPFGGATRCFAGQTREDPMKGIIAWLLGVPVVVIILFYFLDIF